MKIRKNNNSGKIRNFCEENASIFSFFPIASSTKLKGGNYAGGSLPSCDCIQI